MHLMKSDGRKSSGSRPAGGFFGFLSFTLVICLFVLECTSVADAFSFSSRSDRTRQRVDRNENRIRNCNGYDKYGAITRNPSSQPLEMCIDRSVDEELQDLGKFSGEKVDRDNRWMTGT